MVNFGGNGNGRDPFGGGGGDDLVEAGQRLFESLRRHLWQFLLGLAVIAGGLTSYSQVEPEEVGLLLRFGAYSGTLQPGPHFVMPFGVDRVIKVPVQRQLKEEFGFRTQQPGVRTQYETPGEAKREKRMLTGDLNVADVDWIVQYKIRDARAFVFNVRNVRDTMRDISEATMRQVVGDHSVTEVLTIGRERIQVQAKNQLQELCDRYETGIEILQLVLQDVNPPEPVRDSFNEVNQAIQERERLINQAWAKYNTVIPEARGKAKQSIEAAEGYATERVNRSKGDAERFLALQQEYAKAPEVTRTRLYLETMTEVMPRAKRRLFLDQGLDGILPLLSLNQMPRTRKEAE
ncbi:MAG: FtsH protease activity modulator HflK [Myxococcales bacterium]|jgi:membrane protease subunit HflK